MSKKYPQHARQAEFANQATGLSARNVQDALVELAGGDWVSWTPTGTWVTNTTYSGSYKVANGLLYVRVDVVLSGAPTDATLYVDFPPAYVQNTTAIPTWDYQLGGGVYRDTSPGRSYDLLVMPNDANSRFYPCVRRTDTTYSYLASVHVSGAGTAPVAGASGDYVRFWAVCPVVEA